VERLAAMGQWLKVNGDSIYGASPSVFKKLPWGRCTTKPGRLFLHVFDWPATGKLDVPGLTNNVKRAYLLADASKPLPVTTSEGKVVVAVPEAAPDPIASVIVLEIEGEPNVVAQVIRQSEDGSIKLDAIDADIHGKAARYESAADRQSIGFWTRPKDTVSWDFEMTKAGPFTVAIIYACEKGAGGSTYTVSVGDQQVTGTVKDTKAWNDFVSEEIGSLKIDKPGKYTLKVEPKTKPGAAVMNLRAVFLKPTN
jgi:alpha-L-fucosidase